MRMEVPLQVTYRGLEPSDALTQLIRKEADKLGEFFDRIVGCRVLVEFEPHHARSGAPFRVLVDLTIPSDELTIDTARSAKPVYKDPALAVRDAFRRAKRRLQDRVRRMKGFHARATR